jgi:peptide-methionine (S)-S-oxide reductase
MTLLTLQYQAALFFKTEEERQVFENSKQATEKKLGRTVYTGVLPFTEFTLAEDYHQKYYLRGKSKLFNSLPCKTDDELIHSVLACHLNALASGCCTEERAQEILESVKETGNEELVAAVSAFISSPSRSVSCGGF